MRLKNTIFFLLGVSIFAGSASAAYPEHTTLSVHPASVNGISVGASPAENVFSVDGKKFILLDTDTEGDYFVMTEDIYGTHSFVDNASAIDINGWDGEDSEWQYDPQNEASVAYWLNNAFLTNGNGEGKKLPDSIVSNLVEKNWVVENNFPYGQGQVTVEKVGQETYDKYQEWKQNRAELRTIASKVALMSFTEYSTYKNKIGHYLNADVNWIGFMLRTPASETTVSNGVVTLKNNFYQVRTITNNTVVAATPNGSIAYEYQIRPVFWLENDFFKEVRVDVETAGVNIINEIKKNTYTDLADIYSDSELNGIGYNTVDYPKAENIIITGFKCVNALNEIFYDYIGAVKQKGSIFEKYTSDTEDGEFSLLGEGETVSYTDGETADEYIKIAVIPEDESGEKGKRYFLNIFKLKAPEEVMVTECKFTDDDGFEIIALEGVTKINANITFSANTKIHNISLVHYDKDNAVKNMTGVSTNSTDLSYTITLDNISVSEGDSVKVLTETNGNEQPVYIKVLN